MHETGKSIAKSDLFSPFTVYVAMKFGVQYEQTSVDGIVLIFPLMLMCRSVIWMNAPTVREKLTVGSSFMMRSLSVTWQLLSEKLMSSVHPSFVTKTVDALYNQTDEQLSALM